VATCFHHPDRETGRSCTRCDRPACVDCLHEAPVGAHCWECVRAARPPAGERIRRWNATAGPLVATALIGLNVVVFLLTALEGGLAGRGGGVQSRLVLFGPAIAQGEWYRLLTTGFVHFGLLHIAFNMLLLYRFGELLEPLLGRTRFLALYLGSLFTGSFGALFLSPLALTGGASGAVFGLVAAAAVSRRREGVGVWESGIGGLLAVNLLLTFVLPGISIGGHLGGLAGGAVLGSAMLRSPPSRRSTMEAVTLAAVVVALAAVGSGWAATR
jgi:membrane associated rhomboid family serine protease